MNRSAGSSPAVVLESWRSHRIRAVRRRIASLPSKDYAAGWMPHCVSRGPAPRPGRRTPPNDAAWSRRPVKRSASVSVVRRGPTRAERRRRPAGRLDAHGRSCGRSMPRSGRRRPPAPSQGGQFAGLRGFDGQRLLGWDVPARRPRRLRHLSSIGGRRACASRDPARSGDSPPRGCLFHMRAPACRTSGVAFGVNADFTRHAGRNRESGHVGLSRREQP